MNVKIILKIEKCSIFTEGFLYSKSIKRSKIATTKLFLNIDIFYVYIMILGMIGKLKDSFELLKYLSPFEYYILRKIMKSLSLKSTKGIIKRLL